MQLELYRGTITISSGLILILTLHPKPSLTIVLIESLDVEARRSTSALRDSAGSAIMSTINTAIISCTAMSCSLSVRIAPPVGQR